MLLKYGYNIAASTLLNRAGGSACLTMLQKSLQLSKQLPQSSEALKQ